MLLEVIISFVAGFFHKLGIKLADILTNSKQPDQSIAISDQEIWNIVTSYGKYQEVWPIYRNSGLLEAIKARDEKAEFDLKVAATKDIYTQNYPTANLNIESQKKLDEIDLALVRSLGAYLEGMTNKIRHYHQDHHASQEEAEVIVSYYLQTTDIVRNVTTQKDLRELIKFLEILKTRVSRYQHDSYKYRWSTGLEEEVLAKLRKII